MPRDQGYRIHFRVSRQMYDALMAEADRRTARGETGATPSTVARLLLGDALGASTRDNVLNEALMRTHQVVTLAVQNLLESAVADAGAEVFGEEQG